MSDDRALDAKRLAVSQERGQLWGGRDGVLGFVGGIEVPPFLSLFPPKLYQGKLQTQTNTLSRLRPARQTYDTPKHNPASSSAAATKLK